MAGRQKCKEGNLAYFYEAMGGYDRYDFVSQLDADHVPERGYLAEIIRPLRRSERWLRGGAQRV